MCQSVLGILHSFIRSAVTVWLFFPLWSTVQPSFPPNINSKKKKFSWYKEEAIMAWKKGKKLGFNERRDFAFSWGVLCGIKRRLLAGLKCIFSFTILLYFLRFNFLNALQSDNDSKTVYVLRHKFALGLSMSHIYATDINSTVLFSAWGKSFSF